MKEALAYLAVAVLMLFILAGFARAEQTVEIKYMNKCADINPVAPDWKCLNRTQAAQRPETRAQIIEAIRKAKFKKNLTIYSIDPIQPKKGEWEFGAWKRGKYVFFAAMPGCPNARVELTRLLRRLK